MDRGKRPASDNQGYEESWILRKPSKFDVAQEEWKRKKKKEAEEIAKKKKHEERVFAGKMRRLENQLERRGKDWVPTWEEEMDIYGINWPLQNYYYQKDRDINQAYLDRKITDEQRVALLKQSTIEYAAREKELEDIENAEYEEHVKAAEARERRIVAEEKAREERERQAAIERRRQEEEEWDKKYPAVDLSEF